jgi:hypothetical protein
MKPMLGLVPADKSKLGQTSNLLAAAKIVYILKHGFGSDDIAALLRGCDISYQNSSGYLLEAKKMKANQTKYQSEIMEDFFYPRVAIIIGEWQAKVQNADKKFEELTLVELQTLWQEDFDEALEVMAIKL